MNASHLPPNVDASAQRKVPLYAPPDITSWRKGLQGNEYLVSVREVKRAVVNYKLRNPQNYDFARFVLPVTESEIKEQNLPSKFLSGNNANSASSDSSLSPDKALTELVEDDKPSMVTTTYDTKGVIDEQQIFLRRVLEEFNTIKAFKNNLGEPKGELKSLDGDALSQLERCLSIQDQNTPDSWIPRSSELLRLTGKHPFNAEPNLLGLFEAGIITPTKLHFVRNHAAVPKLHWETHMLSVYANPPSLLSKPRPFTMNELTSGDFNIIEIPVTMGCDGNRRKEVNMVKRTVGFDWSASGVSTAVWRGVLVRDVLLSCGVQGTPFEERWYLNFEGADEPADGPYSTAIPLAHAMDPRNDVMLAFGMNRRVLHPDHGYPIRVIIPGYVGGRQVKWLSKMWVSKEPNTSFYHVWDNKVLPSFIDSKNHPLAKIFFEDESTACWEQTLQSVICKPAHDETLLLSDETSLDKLYIVEGFAFNGGGERIERVELSLDSGQTWKYCFRHFVDSPLRHGDKYWAWIFWACEVKIREIIDASELIVRAHDKKKNFQPEHITWNLTGMMNNSWYRVRPSVSTDPSTSIRKIRFQHPVAPGDSEGGWMIPPKEQGKPTTLTVKKARTIALEEIAKHNTKDDAWIILDNKVYDVTSVLSWHPGGAQSILVHAGKANVDATIEYNAIHDNYAHQRRDEGFIGSLSADGIKVMQEDAERAARELEQVKAQRQGFVLQPDTFIPARLLRRKEVNSDSRLYTFELPRKPDGSNEILGLPVGNHIQIALHFEDQAVMRSYTPIRPVLPSEEDGTFDLLVKTYFPLNGSVVSPGGTISNYLDCMEEGEEIDIRGPSGGICYKGHGNFNIFGNDLLFDKLNLVAGGSGLTPHWQLIRAILSDPTDKTCVSLITSNKSVNDIWMRDALEAFAQQHPDRFELWHVVSVIPQDQPWTYSTGRLDKAIISAHFYPSSPGVAAFLCGPTGLLEDTALPALLRLGFEDEKTMFIF